MKLDSLHASILPRKTHGIRAHRLSLAAKAGANVPEGVVIENAGQAIQDEDALREAVQAFLEPGKLYCLRASPQYATWGGPHTFLSLGMNDEVFQTMLQSGDPLSTIELYRQAMVTYGIAVEGMDAEPFEALLSHYGAYNSSASIDKAKALLDATRELYKAELGKDFPQDPSEQLIGAVRSMARQWQSPTARILRQAKDAPLDAHLSLIVQHMVHGLGVKNGAGRAQLFDAETGERSINGFFVTNTLSAASAEASRQWNIADHGNGPSLEKFDKNAYQQLINWLNTQAKSVGDAIEIKFVLEAGILYVTEILRARRNASSGLAILRHLVDDEIITRETAITRIDPISIGGALHPQIDPNAPREVLTQGVGASPGAASGQIVFSPNKALTLSAQGLPTILVRQETGPEDIRGMHAAAGIITQRGGNTSHAAVIARGIGLPCVVGAQDFRFTHHGDAIEFSNHQVFKEGDIITIDGTSGEILAGTPKMVEAVLDESIDHILKWANDIRRMGVRVNADTPADALRAKRFGIEGIGLCRTEHMFFAEDRLIHMRKLILEDNEASRRVHIEALEEAQCADFVEIFEIMSGLPVTIRLLDPPLHEFLPNPNDQLKSIAEGLGLKPKALRARIRELYEVNPMLGMRGVRLGIVMPEIYEMQTRAIFRAAALVNESAKEPVVPEIMIPLVSAVREVELVKARIEAVAKTFTDKKNINLPYRLGVMVETPRAALRAHDLAAVSDFLSMGTNDLTQMTYGLSRDDAGRFMREYVNRGVFVEDPFMTLDLDGVGELVLEAAKRGRQANKNIILGLCGEHGGDPASVYFCELEQFAYVSCSPFRVPIAQIAAAQAKILLDQDSEESYTQLKVD